MRKILLIGCLMLCGLSAQVVVGQTAQNTVYTTLWQDVTGLPPNVIVPNIGAVAHQALISVHGPFPSCTVANFQLQGSGDKTNWVVLDHVTILNGTGITVTKALVGSGLYPYVRVAPTSTDEACIISGYYFGSKSPYPKSELKVGDTHSLAVGGYEYLHITTNTTTIVFSTSGQDGFLQSLIVGTGQAGGSAVLKVGTTTIATFDTSVPRQIMLNMPLLQQQQYSLVTTSTSTASDITLLGYGF